MSGQLNVCSFVLFCRKQSHPHPPRHRLRHRHPPELAFPPPNLRTVFVFKWTSNPVLFVSCAFEFGTRTKKSRARICRVLSFSTLRLVFFSVFPPLPRFFNILLCKLQLIAFGLNKRRATSLFQEIALFVSSNGSFARLKKSVFSFSCFLMADQILNVGYPHLFLLSLSLLRSFSFSLPGMGRMGGIRGEGVSRILYKRVFSLSL